jgi:hypothetical protein
MGKDHSEHFGVDGRIILKCIFSEIRWYGVDWIQVAQDWIQWWPLVNTVRIDIFLTS